MRLRDLVWPHLDGVRCVLDFTRGDLDLRARLGLPSAIDYLAGPSTGDPAAPLGADVLVVLDVVDGEEEAASDVLGRLGDGAQAVLLLPGPADMPAVHRILPVAVDAGCQVLDLMSVDVPGHPVAALVARTTRLRPPCPYLGAHRPRDPAAEPADAAASHRLALRAAGELVLTAYAERGLRASVDRLERERAEAATKAAEQATALAHARSETDRCRREQDALRSELSRLRSQTEQHAAATKDVAARLRREELRRIALERSTSYRVGHALVEGVRRPGQLARLPSRLRSAWRESRGR